MMPAAAAAELREYVRAGGALVAEARAGWNDERGRAADTIPGLGLAEVVGARETRRADGGEGQGGAASADDGLPGLAAGRGAAGPLVRGVARAASPGARVVARFASGAPAAVVSTLRQGHAR